MDVTAEKWIKDSVPMYRAQKLFGYKFVHARLFSKTIVVVLNEKRLLVTLYIEK